MSLTRVIIVAIALLCSGGNMIAAEKGESWLKLKPGMTPAEAKATVGDPLFKSHGRGFELWMYDSGAEVVCFLGVVVAWTGPEGYRTVDGRAIDLRGIKFFVEPPAAAKADAAKTPDFGYEQIAPRTFRLPRL